MLTAYIGTHFQVSNFGFSPDAATTEGVYVVLTLANSLWYVKPHLQTIVQAASERSGVGDGTNSAKEHTMTGRGRNRDTHALK